MSNQPGDYTEPPGSDPRIISLENSRGRGVAMGQQIELGSDHRVMPIGGRGRGVAIGQERRELRRPMEPPPGLVNQDSGVQISDRNNVTMVQSGGPNVDVLQRSNLNACAREFVPSWLQNKAPAPSQPKESSGNADDPRSYTLCHIENTIVQMTLSPGDFDSLSMPLVRFLSDAITSEEMLVEVVDIIFEQSVNEANFRYNGARLSNMLSHHMVLNINSDSYRNVLLKRCHKENQKIASNLQDNKERVFGFSLFVGELYTHLEITPKAGASGGGTSHRIAVLAKALPRILNLIVQQHEDKNVKNVCQVLKFTGAHLAEEEGLEAEMNQLEESLRRASMSPNVAEHLRQMACKVLELKACNWGKSSAPVQQTTIPPQQHNQLITQLQNTNINDEPVFYGPDGQELTEEENQFIAEQLAYLEDDENSENWSTAEGEMDEEMMRDYDQFLKDTQK